MERESLLAILAILLGGAALQLFAVCPASAPRAACPAELERRTWIRLWIPALPMLLISAGLLGWALREPDPVRDPLDLTVLLAAWAPFGLIFVRAALRAAWALTRCPAECGVSTIGLIQPRVVFSPFLAKRLDEGPLHAALAHERAHVVHRDPLRIWLAQAVTDLQWPWPSARRRFDAWLDVLELARDDEARASGADGADLAAAVLVSMRFIAQLGPKDGARFQGTQLAHARLTGDSGTLRNRVSRLLAPVPEVSREHAQRFGALTGVGYLVIPLLTVAVLLGLAYGEQLVRALLAMTA